MTYPHIHASSKYQTFHPTSKRLKPAIIEIVKQTRLRSFSILAPVTATSIQRPVTKIPHRDHRAQQPQQRKLEHGSPILIFMFIFTCVEPMQRTQSPRPAENLGRRDHRPHPLEYLLAQAHQINPNQQQRPPDQERQRAEEQQLADAVTEGGRHETPREREEDGEGVEFAVWEAEEEG